MCCVTATLPHALTIGQVRSRSVALSDSYNRACKDRNRASQDVPYESNVRMSVAFVLARINMSVTWLHFLAQALHYRKVGGPMAPVQNL